ncbi:MAG: DUF4358 domain-containing protein [Clostridia bacterium]|nr:DUF4358 domain-containing protein [Clostridia bacterium]
MKTTIKIFIVTIFIFSLSSCSSLSYADGVKCHDIGNEIHTVLNDQKEYAEFENTGINNALDLSDEYDDFYAVYSTDTNDIDEIAIFHAKSKEDAEEILEACQEYIDDMQENSRAFISSYAPNELPKLDEARVRRFGNYIVYTVLDAQTANSAFEAIKEALKQ